MRKSGILLHITSLPGRYGIGTLGKEAYEFTDFLKEAGQSFWQILPVHPTSYGDSPYASYSTFAGNPYFINFDLLAEKGLLEPEEYENIFWGDDEEQVDFGILYNQHSHVLKKAVERFLKNPDPGMPDSWKKMRTGSMTMLCSWRSRTALTEKPGQSGLKNTVTILRKTQPDGLLR